MHDVWLPRPQRAPVPDCRGQRREVADLRRQLIDLNPSVCRTGTHAVAVGVRPSELPRLSTTQDADIRARRNEADCLRHCVAKERIADEQYPHFGYTGGA